MIENEISEWHFPLSPNGQVEEGSLAARQKIVAGRIACNLPEWAKGLHVFQDSYSHVGKPSKGKYGHPGNPLSADVDDPMKNPVQAKKVSAATYVEIVSFLKACPCIDTDGDGRWDSLRIEVTMPAVWDYKAPDYYNEGSVSHYWTKRPPPPPPYPPHYPPYSEKPPYVKTGEEMQRDFENSQGMRGGQTPRP